MANEDITYSNLSSEEKRIYLSVKSKGYQVSPRAIRENAFEEVWAEQGAATPPFGATTTTTTTTTTTVAPTTTTTTTV